MALSSFFPGSFDWHWVWLVVAAFLAGVLNAIAGGGSFLSFPAMLGVGVPPVQANATNTVALWPGQLTSVAAYWGGIRKNMHTAWPMALAGLMGGVAGATVLLNTPQKTFMHLVPWLLLFAASMFAISGPVSRWLERRKGERTQPSHPKQLPLFFATLLVAFYVGYFGAGAGFLFMTMLSLFGYQDIHDINALKVLANLMANGVAFLIFVFDGQVVWRFCLLAMVVCAIGGYSSARFAKLIPQKVLRTLVVVIGLSMAAWFFWKNG